VKSFDIGEGYVNINTPDDIPIAEQENLTLLDGGTPGH
jgi:hypothetical protein